MAIKRLIAVSEEAEEEEVGLYLVSNLPPIISKSAEAPLDRHDLLSTA